MGSSVTKATTVQNIYHTIYGAKDVIDILQRNQCFIALISHESLNPHIVTASSHLWPGKSFLGKSI